MPDLYSVVRSFVNKFTDVNTMATATLKRVNFFVMKKS